MKKFENFCRALDNLAQGARYEPPYDTVVLTGLVALYEVCFEQAWKAMKDILERHGYSESATGSPRMVLRLAFQAGMLDDQEAWLSALAARNNVTHAYNQALALEIVQRTQDTYLAMFQTLKAPLERDWLPAL